MKDQDKKKPLITITPIRKATEEELAAAAAWHKKTKEKGLPYAKWRVGISRHTTMGGTALSFFPTHDFENIKEYRESVYQEWLKIFSRNE